MGEMDATIRELARRIDYGEPLANLRDELVAYGLDRSSATRLLNNISAAKHGAESSGANKHMLVGGLVCVGGIAVTAVTYSAATDGGGTYVVMWGAILFGAIQFFKGLLARPRPPELLRDCD